MTITTTSSVSGKNITEYLGVVAGEAVIGSHLFTDLFKELRGIVGSRASKFKKDLVDARTEALKNMADSAQKLGANAVVGVDLDYEVLNAGESVLMVIANGTAVVVD